MWWTRESIIEPTSSYIPNIFSDCFAVSIDRLRNDSRSSVCTLRLDSSCVRARTRGRWDGVWAPRRSTWSWITVVVTVVPRPSFKCAWTLVIISAGRSRCRRREESSWEKRETRKQAGTSLLSFVWDLRADHKRAGCIHGASSVHPATKRVVLQFFIIRGARAMCSERVHELHGIHRSWSVAARDHVIIRDLCDSWFIEIARFDKDKSYGVYFYLLIDFSETRRQGDQLIQGCKYNVNFSWSHSLERYKERRREREIRKFAVSRCIELEIAAPEGSLVTRNYLTRAINFSLYSMIIRRFFFTHTSIADINIIANINCW